MTMPCEMGLKCPHCLPDDDGFHACFYPHTAWTISEDATGYELEGMAVMDCPMIEYGSDLERILIDDEDRRLSGEGSE